MNKNRIQSLEKKMKIGIRKMKWYRVFLDEGVYTSDGKVLTKDKEGNLIFEDGEVFYSEKNENTSLIIREII